ncbi:MAG: hypothetical protein ACR2MY_09170 [Candidatus Dormibacteria bacterium]
MNYDHFEREVLGYQAAMQGRAERRRRLRPGGEEVRATGGNPVRFRLAGVLRSLADQLDAQPAHPAHLA